MQPAYRVGRMASATQPRRREQVIFKMTVMMMKVMVMKVIVMKVMVIMVDRIGMMTAMHSGQAQLSPKGGSR